MIKGFWHIYMINHWYSVVTDQMRILLASGLYDMCENISIGCLGSKQEKDYLEKYVVNVYPKLKICYYSDIPERYEFPTLKLIEDDKSDYKGFYFHAKGVTKPADTMVNHWRAYLNEAILNKWQQHWLRVGLDYDVSSVNHLKSPDHYSGNYWWFNRKFINKLPLIHKLDHSNRWHAEQWICMGKGRYYWDEFKEPGDNAFLMEYRKYDQI